MIKPERFMDIALFAFVIVVGTSIAVMFAAIAVSAVQSIL